MMTGVLLTKAEGRVVFKFFLYFYHALLSTRSSVESALLSTRSSVESTLLSTRSSVESALLSTRSSVESALLSNDDRSVINEGRRPSGI